MNSYSNLNSFVIYYDDDIVVHINNLPEFVEPLQILRAYSDYSGFPLSHLYFRFVNKLDFTELKIV